MGRTPCCESKGVRRGQWTAEEDQILIAHIQNHGHANWRALPKKAGLQRCGKSCRLRWVNYLSPDVKRGNLTSEEEEIIISLHQKLGNKWSAIAARLPGRTDNEIKNVWNTHLKKRVMSNENGNMKSSNSSSSSNNLRAIDQKGVDYSHHHLHGHDHALIMEDFTHMVGGCQASQASSEISSSQSDYSSISSQAACDQSVDYGLDYDPAEINFNELQDLSSSGFLSEPGGLGIATIDWMDGESPLSSIAWEEEEGEMGYWMRMLVQSGQAQAEF